MRERDCAKYWSDLSLHGNISHKERDIIMDRMRTTKDQCTKAFYDKKSCRMERITENNPTPLLEIEIIKDNGETFSFGCLPDSGTTKAIVAIDLAVKHGLKWTPVPYNHILTDAQGDSMNVECMTVIKVHAKIVDGSLNKNGKFHLVPCIISSTLVSDIFLARSDLIKIGSLPQFFPEVWSSKNKWLENRATMTPGERYRNTNFRLDASIEELFDKFQDVFAENLDGGKTMKVPMDIILDEVIADIYRGKYSTSVK